MSNNPRREAARRMNDRKVTLAEDGGKTCTGCQRHLTKESFRRDSTMADGRRGQCKDCQFKSTMIVYSDTPLKRARYERVLVNNTWMDKYVTQ